MRFCISRLKAILEETKNGWGVFVFQSVSFFLYGKSLIDKMLRANKL